MSEGFDAALALVAAGFPVFPVYEVVDNRCTCGRRACQSPGKHPRTKGGHLSATLAAEQIGMWWRCWPDANIGVRTGSGLLVLDIDPRNDGDRSLKALIEAHGALPETPTVSTGGGGFHFFFRVDEKVPCKSAVWPGIDVKADGGYVVVPTSVHESGRAYEWKTGFSIDDLPRAPAPRWLLAELCKKKSAAPVAGSVASGARNNHLMSVAGRLRRDGSEQAAILSAIKLENQRACTPPLEGDEVGRIAASASRYSNGGASSVAQVLDASGVATLSPQSRLTPPENVRASRDLDDSPATGEQNRMTTKAKNSENLSKADEAVAGDTHGDSHEPPPTERHLAPRVALFDTVEVASAKLSLDPTALRARLRRAQRADGDMIVADLGGGIRAFKFGKSWRIRFPKA